MIIRNDPISNLLAYPLDRVYNLKKTAFFDIETTGFSAESTFLYLIGCIYHDGSSFHLIQWFSEDVKEETLLLKTFFEFLRDYDILIHYNGTGFDIPYLNRKCSMLHLDYSFVHIQSIDLYKRILPYKKILQLASYKQKSVEEFLQIRRKDTLQGEDLLQVYAGYLGKKHYETLRQKRNPESLQGTPLASEEFLQQLLLHNEDDLKGLLGLCSIFAYTDLFEKPPKCTKTALKENIFILQCEVAAKLPVPIRFGNSTFYVTAKENMVIIQIKVYIGTLKYFYDNVKDYYYLPSEDMAIHKSLASYVDKECREKAKHSNCYIKKEGVFIPQFNSAITPFFRDNYNDKSTYIEITPELMSQYDELSSYASHIINTLLTEK